MSSELSSGGFTVLVAMLSIWGLVALVLYVWYLWALSKLFPYLGLPSRDGWIPVWNQWQLLKRGGLPGWLVLLGFVPGLILVVIIVSIIAIHRLNREFGKDAWYTVLGAFLPPIWAMLLASHIGDGMYAGARVYQGETAFPPLSPSRRAAAVAAGGGAGSPAASEPAAWRGLPPVSEAALAEAHREPSDPQRAGGAEPVAPVTSPSTGASGSERVRAAADPHDMNDWGFSNTTIGNFERLAAEEVEERPATPLGVRAAPEPFAWPEPRAPRAAAPAPPADLSTPAEPVVPAAPAVTAVPPTPEIPAAPEPPVVPVPPVVPELPVEEQPEPAAAPAAQRWGLELPDGEVLELVGTDIVAGRKPSSLEGSETLLLADPTRTVSKSHVRLRLAGGEWTVEDLNSTNGLTLVSSSGQRAQLPAGLTFPATEHMIFGTLEVHLRAL